MMLPLSIYLSIYLFVCLSVCLSSTSRLNVLELPVEHSMYLPWHCSTDHLTKYQCLGFEPPKLECASPMGVEFLDKIPDSAMMASTQVNQYYGPERGRLRNQNEGSYGNCWLAQKNEEGQWIQVDLGKIANITRIGMQGRQDAAHWVKSYTLSYSLNCGIFESYQHNLVWCVSVF